VKTIDIERQTPEAPPQSGAGESPYEACEHCAAPVETTQRYCVVCGTRRKHVYDPSARYLSSATSLARAQRTPVRVASPRRRSFGLGAAAILVAIPLAVAAGVLVGRAGTSSDGSLIAALKAQKPTVVSVGGGAVSGASSGASTIAGATSTSTLTSTFSLTRGFAVELAAIAHPTASSVSAAEHKARSKGAPAVGLIAPSAFTLVPAPPSGDAVIYSGQFKTKTAADSALAKLTHQFPSAKVVAVTPSGGAASGKVLAKTNYGTVNQATGFRPTANQLAAGRQIAAKTAKQLNGSYVKAQQGLPSQVSVP
jgi:hypothetical protein